MEIAEGTVIIRMKGLNKGEPVTFKYPKPLNTSITFNEVGVAEVPLAVAKRLLGPDFEGIYEQLAKSEQAVKAEKVGSEIKPAIRKPKQSTTEGSGDVKDFLTKMDEPLAGNGSSNH